MSLITYGVNATADQIVQTIMDGRVPSVMDVLALAQEAVRLTPDSHHDSHGSREARRRAESAC